MYGICAGFSLEYTGLGTSETSLDTNGGVSSTSPFDGSEPVTTIVPEVAPVTVTLDTTSTESSPVLATSFSPQAAVPVSLKKDSLHLGFGDLEFKLSNVSGLLNKVGSFVNISTVTHKLGQFFEGVNITALQEQFEDFKAYVASSVTMQILLVCSTLSLLVGCGLMSLVVRQIVIL
jgi:hypothetical protein